MLEAVDEAAFAKASHAYGKANDVPGLLRDLTDEAEKKRSDALWKLSGAICHQGTLFSATALAVPHLLELVASPKVPGRAQLLGLLADIVTLDDHERFLLNGYPKKLGGLPAAFKAAIAAVQAGGPVVAKLLSDKEPAVRAAAAFLVTWLGDPATYAPAIAKALAKEKDDDVKVSLVLALGFLDAKAKPKLEGALTSKHLGLKTAAALAMCTVTRGETSDKVHAAIQAAASKKKLVVPYVLFAGGDLSVFATNVLLAIGGNLARVVAADGASVMLAANAGVRQRFEVKGPAPKTNYNVVRRDHEDARILAALPVKVADLDELQRPFLDALAGIAGGFDNDLTTALAERGLPPTKALLTTWLVGDAKRGKGTRASTSLLDRPAGKVTLGELYVKATREKGEPDAKTIDAIEASTTVDERVALALEGLAKVEVSWSMAVALELLWRNAPKASSASMSAIAKLTKTEAVAVGVAQAARAIAKKATLPTSVDVLLQQANGYWPIVRRALVALPEPRREKWLLHEERDNEVQPAEFFTGAWQYFGACPTTTIADHALAHIANWKPKDRWGQPRKRYGDPRLKQLIADFRAARNKADAKRLEEAYARLQKS